MTIPAEVARLYEELRDCIRANDQQGVRRIFGELVRARRPVSEISGVVDGLSKAAEKEEAEAGSPLDDTPRPSAAPEFDSTTPEPTDQDPDRTMDPGVVLARDEDGAVAATSEPEGDRVLVEKWAEPTSVPKIEQSTPEAASQIGDWATATYSEPESSQDTGTPSEEIEPSDKDDIAWSSDAVPPPGRRTRLLSAKIRICAALLVVVAILGTGIFLLRPAVKGVGAGTMLPVESASNGSADLPATVSAPAGQASIIAAPDATSPDRRSDVAATAQVPGPTPTLPAIAPAMPEARSAGRPNETSPITSPEAPNKAANTGSTAPEASAPTASRPAIAAAVLASPPVDQRASKPAVENTEIPTKAAAVVPPAADRSASAVPPPATAPAVPEGTPADRSDPKSVVASLEAPKNPAAAALSTSAAPSTVTPATANPESMPAKDSPSTSVETASLLDRGDRLFGVGDIASARLFYERAADAGDGQAALRLGETYDPAFLERAQLRVQGDRSLAVFWYRRARELGASEAEILLKGAQAR